MTRIDRILSLSLVSLGCTLGTLAQSGQNPQQPDAGSARSQQQAQRDMTRRLWILNDLERQTGNRSERTQPASRPVIDKAAQARVELLRRVTMKDAAPYLELLKGKDAGIFKVFPNMNCISEQVISVAAECADFVPMSSHVSFRLRAYIDEPNQDIEYVNGELHANGFFVQGALRDLGDVKLETAIADTTLISAIKSIGSRDSLADDARTTAGDLKNGLQVRNNTFNSRLKATVGHTYLFRSIAYKAKTSLPPVSAESTAMELRFHVLTFDKRSDLTMVFRLLSRDEHGGLTIVWKEVDRVDAPTLRFAKGQPLADFK